MPIPEFSGYWVTVPLGLMMFGWLVYELRSQRTVPAISAGEISAITQSTSSIPFPDWPIRELFFYIRPDLVDNHTDHTWEKVGLEIKDKLSIGQLKIWGRVDGNERMPLSEINQDYWQLAEFTYWFLSDEDGAQFLVHAVPRIYRQHAGLPQYRDLQVNKEQAIRLWPEKGFFEHNAKNKDAAILRLTKLRGKGVAIRNDAANIQYTNHLDAWSGRVTEWMHEVIAVLKIVSAADSEWFATLDTVGPARVQVPIRLTGQTDISMLMSTYNQHDLRLVRLENLLKKYGVAA